MFVAAQPGTERTNVRCVRCVRCPPGNSRAACANSGHARPARPIHPDNRELQPLKQHEEFHFPMTSDDRPRRVLYGLQRQFQDTPARSARAEGPSGVCGLGSPAGSARSRSRSVGRGRVAVVASCSRLGTLARAIYANPIWDQDFNLRKKGRSRPNLRAGNTIAFGRAAPTFADCVGRSTSPGRPWLWRVRSDQFWWNVRRREDRARQGRPVFWRHAAP